MDLDILITNYDWKQNVQVIDTEIVISWQWYDLLINYK
jgi:hypothetical protein